MDPDLNKAATRYAVLMTEGKHDEAFEYLRLCKELAQKKPIGKQLFDFCVTNEDLDPTNIFVSE